MGGAGGGSSATEMFLLLQCSWFILLTGASLNDTVKLRSKKRHGTLLIVSINNPQAADGVNIIDPAAG